MASQDMHLSVSSCFICRILDTPRAFDETLNPEGGARKLKFI